jgi:hypothetical protein
LRALLYLLKAFDRSFKIKANTWEEARAEFLSPVNMIEKRLELIPIGLDETMENYKKGDTSKIIWREVGFLKYFETFKRVFQQFKKTCVEIRPTSMRWIKDLLEVLLRLVKQLIEFD